jgi:transcriptional regulator with XRE-family HTH domain
MDKENKQFLKELGKLVVKNRKKINKSERYISDYLNINLEELNLIENGEQETPPQTLSKLNKLFAIDLMTATENNFKKIKNNNQKIENNFSKILGGLIYSKRKRQKFSKNELAEKIHITKHTLLKIENGEQEVPLQILSKLNKLFAINLITATENKLKEIKNKNQKKYTSFAEILGNLIYYKRRSKNLSQNMLAEKMHITRITLSKIENGNTHISAQKLAFLDKIFTSSFIVN